jgi:hypothetical protein
MQKKSVPNKIARKGVGSLLTPNVIPSVPFKIVEQPPDLPTIAVVQNRQYDIPHYETLFQRTRKYCKLHNYIFRQRQVRTAAYINNSYMLTMFDGFFSKSIDWIVIINQDLIIRDMQFELTSLINQVVKANSPAMIAVLKDEKNSILIVKRSAVKELLTYHYNFHNLYKEEEHITYVEDFINFMYAVNPTAVHLIDSYTLVSKDWITNCPFISYTLEGNYLKLQSEHLTQLTNEQNKQ